MDVPTKEEFTKGCEEFHKQEKREPMYKVATFLIKHYWGKPEDMADGLGVLLLTWNNAFYRYGKLDFDALEKAISKNLKEIERFKSRDISGLLNTDEKDVIYLFNEFLDALKIYSKKGKEKRSPVSVAKALHLLAPDFFPLWDEQIAQEYGCRYSKTPAETYFLFCNKIKEMVGPIKNYSKSKRGMLKLIDEYNYAKYTKGWV